MAEVFKRKHIRNEYNNEISIGWGQFLDTERPNKQVGPYGTAAGCIVLSLADERDHQIFKKANSKLLDYWYQKECNEKYAKHFTQIPRLSTLYFALRLSEENTDSQINIIKKQLENARISYQSCWGNFWYSKDICANKSSIVSTSLCLIAFSFFNDNYNEISTKFEKAIKQLEFEIINNRSSKQEESCMALSAILSLKNHAPKEIQKIAKTLSLNRSRDIDDRYPFFFDYEFPFNKSTKKNSETKTKYHRDYFFIPTTIMLAIAGLQSSSPAYLKIYADIVLEKVYENLDENDGLYKPDDSSRISTFEQVWVAILLKYAILSKDQEKFKEKFKYNLFKQRKNNKLSYSLYLIAILFATSSNTIMYQQSLIQKALPSVLLIILICLGGYDVISELFKKILNKI